MTWAILLLLLLSHSSRVQLCATPETAVHQAPLSLGFCRQEHWVAISFSNVWKWKVKSESEDAQSCPIRSDPMDCNPPGSSVHGIFQAKVLEWVAISFSRGSSWSRDQTQVSRPVGRRFTVWATREVQIFQRCYQNEGKGKSTQCDPVWSRQWPSWGAAGRRSQTIMEKVGKLRKQCVEY